MDRNLISDPDRRKFCSELRSAYRRLQGVNHVEIENLKSIKMDKMHRKRSPVACENYSLFEFSRFWASV